MQLAQNAASVKCACRIFQYPRSDRRRCNAAEEWLGVLGTILSVSSVGSEAMQQIPPEFPPESFLPFSILGRIGGDATSAGPRDRNGSTQSLSVSSVGSEAMQHLELEEPCLQM